MAVTDDQKKAAGAAADGGKGKQDGTRGLKEQKEAEELSEEDARLKEHIELMVERIGDSQEGGSCGAGW